MKVHELPPIKERGDDYDAIEREIKEKFRKEIYLPALRELGEPVKALKNSSNGGSDLNDALRSGRVTFYRGQFSGRFNSRISQELRDLGARFDRRQGVFKIEASSLPMETRNVISASADTFARKISLIDSKLAQILPADFAATINVSKHFDRALWKTDKAFRKSVDKITVAPQLSPRARKAIADEWQNNMEKWITDFTEKEITTLRKDMQASVFKGNRYGDAVKTIQKSYGVTARKAKFLARQETGLLMAQFKKQRYTDAGVLYYKWGTVAGTKKHPVRPAHKALDGKIFSWQHPPITTAPGEAPRRNNPGEDYNCRCFAKPLVGYKPNDGKEFKG